MKSEEGSPKASPDLLGFARMETPEVLGRLESHLEGLDEATACVRLESCGLNIVAHEAAPRHFHLAVLRVVNPLVILLLILATASLLFGDIRAAAMMLIMIAISVSLGSFQEFRSNQAAAKLEAKVSTSATVVRRTFPQVDKGVAREIPQKDLVPGDIILLSAGDLVPADVRLLTSKDVSVSQAMLTGESLPVDKHGDRKPTSIENPFEIPNLCFLGSSVLSGTATAVVVTTGRKTFLGILVKSIAGQRAPTSFDRGIAGFTWLMIWFIVVIAPLVFLINGLLKGNWVEALLFALSVAVGLTPEMLPMIVTVNLAKGALVMAKKKVIVKRLGSIENFGGIDVLCADKTGTLTQNQVILEKHLDVHGHETPDVLKYAYLNSFHQTGLKNLLDAAVLKHGQHDHIRRIEKIYDKVDEIPFDFSRKRMSVVVHDRENQSHLLICKGAVEEVFQFCSKGRAGRERFPLDPSHSKMASEISQSLNRDGFRVVALAYKELPPVRNEYSVADETDLTLMGYLAFLDPPKETAAEAIREMHQSGVAVKILTGDNEVISRKICNDVGLDVDQVLLGGGIEKMSDPELVAASVRTSVFAKLTPDQKARIIRCLQKGGHVVGFLGDGVNDGPALRTADVGISVDSAVDIAKESADIILLEKSLSALHDGVIEGRNVFANIIKYIKMSASSNFGNMFSVLGASAFLPFLPMQPIQVLTNNLLYDISQTTIPTDNVDSEFLLKPQQWDLGAIRQFIFVIGPISSVFDYLTFFVLLSFFGARSNPALFQTGWFIESLATQTLVVHVIRTYRIPFIQSRASVPVLITSILTLLAAVWLPTSPLASTLRLTPLPSVYWLFLVVTLFCYVALTQTVKERWFGRWYPRQRTSGEWKLKHKDKSSHGFA
jgi:Mg2+-importing ATPase